MHSTCACPGQPPRSRLTVRLAASGWQPAGAHGTAGTHSLTARQASQQVHMLPSLPRLNVCSLSTTSTGLCQHGPSLCMNMVAMFSVPPLPQGHVGIKPRRGDGLLFWSYEPDGHTDDIASTHEGCPVIKGAKWTTTFWIHTKPFRPVSESTFFVGWGVGGGGGGCEFATHSSSLHAQQVQSSPRLLAWRGIV
jgi:hypothetical protein